MATMTLAQHVVKSYMGFYVVGKTKEGDTTTTVLKARLYMDYGNALIIVTINERKGYDAEAVAFASDVSGIGAVHRAIVPTSDDVWQLALEAAASATEAV